MKTADPLARAAAALERGGVIVFPTETLYGLGADAMNPAAVEQVFSLKGRDSRNPIPILVADEAMLQTVVAEAPTAARRLMDRFWPGPLTLVLRARDGLPGPLVNREGAIGVRISSHPVAAALVRALGRPLTATSANPSGETPARTVDQAMHYFSAKIEVFLDGGRLASERGSTVVAVRGDAIEIIREGEIEAARLRDALESSG